MGNFLLYFSIGSGAGILLASFLGFRAALAASLADDIL